MTELHPDILRQAVEPQHHPHSHHHHHHHRHAATSGVVVVDGLEACLKEAGEIIQAELKPEQLVEIGELMMIKKAAMKEIELGGEGEKGLREWIVKGNVLYKSVGLGLMDLRVGWDLVVMARERGLAPRFMIFETWIDRYITVGCLSGRWSCRFRRSVFHLGGETAKFQSGAGLCCIPRVII